MDHNSNGQTWGDADRVTCLKCRERIEHDEARQCAPKKIFEHYDKSILTACLRRDSSFNWCLSPTCNSGQISDCNSTTPFKCKACGFKQCIEHGVAWHENETCKEYSQRVTNTIDTNISKYCKPCPQCKTMLKKNRGCDHMTCPTCQFNWCWGCGCDWTHASGDATLHKKWCPGFYHSKPLITLWRSPRSKVLVGVWVELGYQYDYDHPPPQAAFPDFAEWWESKFGPRHRFYWRRCLERNRMAVEQLPSAEWIGKNKKALKKEWAYTMKMIQEYRIQMEGEKVRKRENAVKQEKEMCEQSAELERRLQLGLPMMEGDWCFAYEETFLQEKTKQDRYKIALNPNPIAVQKRRAEAYDGPDPVDELEQAQWVNVETKRVRILTPEVTDLVQMFQEFSVEPKWAKKIKRLQK
jgi:hypothetical protein